MRQEAWYGSNTGNILFLTAADRLLSSPKVLVDTDRRSPDRDIGFINETYDHYVLPLSCELTSARPLLRKLERFTRIIERLTIPVCVLGIGAQSTYDYSLEPLRPAEPQVRRFMSAVLDHGPSIGVRGEFTAHYLASLGYRDVEVIGCPSMFINGPRLDVVKRRDSLTDDSPVSIVGSMQRLPAMATVYRRTRFRDLVVVEQDDREHPEGEVRRFTDVDAWFSFLATREFVFGSRIHGNMAAAIAGTPSYVLAHDSRTLELARYFEIPHRRLSPEADARKLYESADYGPLNAGHAARWQRLVAYLGRHGLEP